MLGAGDCLRHLWKMARRMTWRMAVNVLTGLVQIGATLAFVVASKRLVDIATGESDAAMGPAVALFCGIILVRILCRIFSSFWEPHMVALTQNRLRYEYFSKVLGSSWNGMETFRSGDVINRLEEDVRVVSELVCVKIPELFVTVLQLIAASCYLLCLAPSLLWVLIILAGAAVVGARLFYRKQRELTSTIRRCDSEAQQLMQENIQNRVLVLTIFGSEGLLSRLGKIQKNILRATESRLGYNAIARAFMNLGFMGGYAAAFLWGVFGIRSGAVTYGMMTAFLQLVSQVQAPIAEIGRAIPAFIHAMTSIERLAELDALPGASTSGGKRLAGALGVRVEGLSFSYQGQEKPVLRDFSADFLPGKISVIMGPTGIGKSTLIRLILGLLTPSEGSVSIYSPSGGSLPAKEAGANFTYVPQGNTLLSGTIRENLLAAAPGADEAQIKAALHNAVADFVLELPEGLDTVCGEDGSGLSEGQCQRIAIARALLHGGGIMIMDEATSALDPATEEKLLGNLSRLGSALTVIFISHREAALSVASNIIRIE